MEKGSRVWLVEGSKSGDGSGVWDERGRRNELGERKRDGFDYVGG